jgi:fatty aldehyde-generating acyl-ACP reductase
MTFSAPVFATLGHTESWTQVGAIIQALRPPDLPPLTDDELRQVVPWLPPRTVTRISVAAAPHAGRVHGVYIDTFITPDELAQGPTRRVLNKVRDGIRAAEREGVRIATLGGFTSILLEAMTAEMPAGPVVTTGNTLTAALIARGVERATQLLGRDLDRESLLVIGATGDVGSACARYFAGRTRRLLLAARHGGRLEVVAQALRERGPVAASTDVAELLRQATLVIAAASIAEPAFPLAACTPDAVVCDAGYPKNIRSHAADTGRRRLFWGGMGVVGGGLHSDDGNLAKFYSFPVADAAHGCMLEAAVLAIAGRFEAFSVGRGRISPERVEEMWGLARVCGVSLAPLFGADGVWPEELAA